MFRPSSHTYEVLRRDRALQVSLRVLGERFPFHLLNVSCTTLYMHRTAQPLALQLLAPLSMWTLVHPVSGHLLMLIVLWFIMGHTLPAVLRPKNDLHPILVVVLSPQVVQVPVLARTMTHRVMMMTTTMQSSSKISLAARWST